MSVIATHLMNKIKLIQPFREQEQVLVETARGSLIVTLLILGSSDKCGSLLIQMSTIAA